MCSVPVPYRNFCRAQSGRSCQGVRYGEPPADVIFIEEHGVRYGVQLTHGQKTGFYLDQRENRLAAARMMRGRRVLDVCCYSGGFGLAAVLRGGAKEVLGIDASGRAVSSRLRSASSVWA